MVGKFEYAPGNTVLIAGPGVAVLANIDPTSDLALALAAQAESPSATIDSMLEILVAPGLRAVDSFALLASSPENSRIVVRGQFRGIGEGSPELVGRGLWSDHTITSQQVRIEASQPGPVWLQITHGVVLASACRLSGIFQPYDEVSVMTHRASDIRRMALAASDTYPDQEVSSTSTATGEAPNASWNPAVASSVSIPTREEEPTIGPEPGPVSTPAATPVNEEPPEIAPRRSAPRDEESATGQSDYDFDGLFDIEHTRSAGELQAEAELAEPSGTVQPGDSSAVNPGGSFAVEPDASSVAEPVLPQSVSGHTLPSPMTGELPAAGIFEPNPQPVAKPTFISSFPWATDSTSGNQDISQVSPNAGAGGVLQPTGGQPQVPSMTPEVGRVLEPAVQAQPAQPQGPAAPVHQPGEAAGVPMVLAIRCPTGHLNAVHTESCRVCGLALSQQQAPISVPRPPLGVLRLGSGGTVLLDRGAILGRNPRLPRGLTGLKPNLVRLPDPDRDISSVHLEVNLDGWRVTVTDLGSTNGTQLELPGSPPISLRPKDPHTIEPGTKVTLAEVCSFTFEVIE